MTDEPEDNVVYHPSLNPYGEPVVICDPMRRDDRVCDPSESFESAMKMNFQHVVIIGLDENGENILFSTHRYMADTCFQLDRVKAYILKKHLLFD